MKRKIREGENPGALTHQINTYFESFAWAGIFDRADVSVKGDTLYVEVSPRRSESAAGLADGARRAFGLERHEKETKVALA